MPRPSRTPDHQGRPGGRCRPVGSQDILKECLRPLRDGRVIWLQRPVRQARCLGDALVISLADVRRLRISPQRGAQAIPGRRYPWQKSPSSGSKQQKEDQEEHRARGTGQLLGSMTTHCVLRHQLPKRRIKSALLGRRLARLEAWRGFPKGKDMERGPTHSVPVNLHRAERGYTTRLIST
jgi:hypothetical protein